MQSLNRVVRRGAHDQHRIEVPFVGLQRLNFGFAYGQLAMIAAGPGVGMSALALQLALDGGLPTLYISADTDSWTMTVRALAHLTGHQQTYITQCLEGGAAKAELALAMEDGAHGQFSFDSYTTADVLDDVKAYAVVHGDWPRLIIIDNLLNLARGGDDDLSSQTKAMDELHALAAMTGACVLVLHHATGQFDDGDKPIPLSGLANKLSKLPAQILTLYKRDSDVFLCVTKNRQGRADPSGKLQVRTHFDGERMIFRDGS